jgi:hypothetical protein
MVIRTMEEFDLFVGSTAMLTDLLAIEFRWKLHDEVSKWIHNKWKYPDFNFLLLEVLLRKSNLAPRAKARFLQVNSWALPTNGWLKSKGLISDGSCLLCDGCIDIVVHQLSRHSEIEDELAGHLKGMEPVDFIELVDSKEPEVPKQQDLGIQCFINGASVPWEEFFFESGLVGTDGSSVYSKWPHLASAGSAAYQIDSKGYRRAMRWTLPKGFP